MSGIVKTMTAKKNKGKSKSAKDKTRNAQKPQVPINFISGPSMAGRGEGLYVKLTQHQKTIGAQISIISTALENGHQKLNLTSVITIVLEQLVCAVTTTHQSLTREVYDKNNSLKPRLEYSESQLYSKVACLVRWADFELKEQPSTSPEEKARIMRCVNDFEKALTSIVTLVAEAQHLIANSHSETIQRMRKTSFDDRMVYSVRGSEDVHPQVAALKHDVRKASWSPGMAGPPSPRQVRRYGPPPNVFRDSTHSESSSTSDEEKRRSGSNERQLSPEHNSMSTEWESRNRSRTTPVYSSSVPTRGGGVFPPAPIPVPVPIPTVPTTIQPLPNLPGEEAEQQPPLPPKKGHTLPRMSEAIHVNGRFSPEYPVHSEEDQPPPIPMKKKHMQSTPLNGHTGQSTEEVPPPVPVKRRGKGPFSSPTHTPIRQPIDSPSSAERLFSKSVDSGGYLDQVPRVPVRIESIPALKSALVQETPPPKPPRTDRPPSSEMPSVTPHTPHPDVISAMRKYNEDLMKSSASPDAKPPVPLKKRTVLMYNLMVQNYTFDEGLVQPLYISKEEPPPPPIPPKKRRARPVPVHVEEQAGIRDVKPDTSLSSNLSASSEDMFTEDAEDGEVCYLECEEASGYLIFNREEGGGYTLRGGPIDALIAYAASTTTAVKHFSEAFLLTYYTFIKPEGLISRLLYRLDFFYKQQTLAVWTATTSLLVRVLTGLNQPLVKEAEVKLIDMIHQMLSDGNLKFAQLLRNALVEKLNQLIPDRRASIPLGKAMSSNASKLSRSLLDFQPDDVAKQMTILDNELFQKVDVAEMLYWAAEQSEEKSPQLTQFTMHFNNVSQWTKTKLLERAMDMRTRVKLILHFISIMKCLREHYNNFNSYLAILSAIESSPVSRLDWPDRVIKGLEEPRALIDNRGSFKNYREAFAQAKPPCIPYIGLYLQDLTFIEMQPSYLEDKTSINFTKRWKQFKSVDHIRFAQTKQYTGVGFDPDPEILGLFSNFEIHVTDEELWATSNEIKPSARAQKPQQTAQ